MNQQRRKDSDAAAQKRPSLCKVQGIGQRAHPCPLRSNARRPARVASGWLVATMASAATAGGLPKANR